MIMITISIAIDDTSSSSTTSSSSADGQAMSQVKTHCDGGRLISLQTFSQFFRLSISLLMYF